MPSAEAALFAILTTGSPNAVAAIVGPRVYFDSLPQPVVYPAIRFSRISTPRSEWRTLDGHANYATPRFQLDCYAINPLSALNLGQAVYALLEGFAGTVSGVRIDAISTEDEASTVEMDAAEGGEPVYDRRIDVLIYHAE